MTILGISAFYHDSAAALICDGKIIAAAQEERFTRKKQDSGFPIEAIKYCLKEGNVHNNELDAVVFYDKPILKFTRILETYFSIAPKGLRSFMMAIPLWLKEKLWIPMRIEEGLEECGVKMPEDIFYPEHHEAHAASAFFPSPFDSAAILTLDGVGEWATSAISTGKKNKIEIKHELRFPHSLGLLYSAFTYYTGFKVNSGEYKLMGLAPYGEPKFVDLIYDNLIDIHDDGSFHINVKYFDYLGGLTMTNEKFGKLFGGPARKPETEITQREMDIAKSIQVVTEEIVLKMAKFAHKETNEKNLCLAGGVALNCVSNGRLLREGSFEKVWIQPAAGDAGGALGAALFAWYQIHNNERKADGVTDFMSGSQLGPEFSDDKIEAFLKENNYSAENFSKNEDEWAKKVAELINEQKVVGLFQGRMEFGPRALGNRSIIGDARSSEMQTVMNLKIKYRESFRPFAPSCLAERVNDFFELAEPSPYMLLVAPVKKERCIPTNSDVAIRDRVNQKRSDIPAITHVDYSARVQTVSPETNLRYYKVIKAFEELTGEGIIINTSFNVRGEPIVCSPEDAYRCFMRTEMDFLILGSFILDKKSQPEWKEEKDWRKDYVLD